jgi:flagellar basal-body rod protein FlgF
MDQSEVSLAASLHALVHQQNAVANNIANVGSTAFKRQAGCFRPFEVYLDKQQSMSTTVPAYEEGTDLSQGDVSFTGDLRHIALEGDGMLRVRDAQMPGQILLTRNGALGVDANGNLTAANGRLVLDTRGQPVNVGDSPEFRIGATGEISDSLSGDLLGKIDCFAVPDKNQLETIGAGVFRFKGDQSSLKQDPFTLVRQSNLERANVNTIQEMVSMIAVQRHFEAVTKALGAVQSTTDQLNQLAQG